MEDSKQLVGSSTVSLPRWLSKTHSKYDDEDIDFSPPSEDGASYFSFHIDNSNPKTAVQKSTFDRINQELGFTEITGEPRVGLGTTPRSSGLCLSTELQDERIEHQARSDLLFNPIKSNTTNSAAFNPYSAAVNSYNPITAAARKISIDVKAQHRKHEPAFHIGDEDEFEEEQDNTVGPLKNFHGENYNFNQEQSFDQLSVYAQPQQLTGLFSKIRNLLPRSTVTTSRTSPPNTPLPLRKTSVPGTPYEHEIAHSQSQPSNGEYFSSGGVVINRTKMPSYNSFFFRQVEADTASNTVSGSTAASTNIVAGSATSTAAGSNSASVAAAQQAAAQKQQQGNMSAVEAGGSAATTPTHRMRKPKPSRLREMNFWAPTSM